MKTKPYIDLASLPDPEDTQLFHPGPADQEDCDCGMGDSDLIRHSKLCWLNVFCVMSEHFTPWEWNDYLMYSVSPAVLRSIYTKWPT